MLSLESRRHLVLLIGLIAGCGRCGPDHGASEGLLSADGEPFAQNLVFGNVPVGQSETLSLIIKNSGNAPLKIEKLTLGGASPGDFTAGAVKSSSVPAGSSTTASVVFKPSIEGPRQATLTITTDSAAIPSLLLTLTGTGTAVDLSISPEPVDFGNVQVGAPAATISLQLSNTGNVPVTLTASPLTGSQAAWFSVGAGFGGLAPGSNQSVTLTFTPPSVGNASATLPLQVCSSSGPSNCSNLSVTLEGVGVDSQLVFNPNPIAFSYVPAGTSDQTSVTLTNSGTADVSLTGLVTQSGSSAVFALQSLPASFPVDLPAGQAITFTVQYTPSTNPGGDSDAAVATYLASGEVSETATAPLTGAGVATPCSLALSPTALSFASVATGTPVAEAVTLNNSGTTDCQISSIQLDPSSDPGYALAAGTPASLTVAAGGSAQIGVQYLLPAETPPFTRLGSLTFQSNDPNLAAAAVPLNAYLAMADFPCSLTVAPSALAYGTVSQNTPTTLQVTLTNVGQVDCQVSAVALSAATDPDYTLASSDQISFTVAVGSSATLGVAFDAPNANGSLTRTGDLLFDTTDPTQPSVDVPLTASIYAPVAVCGLSIAPPTLSYGTVAVNTPTTLNVVVTNTSTTSCQLSNVALAATSDPDYALAGTDLAAYTLAAGSSASLGVVFDAPSDVPPLVRNGTLLFDTTDPTQASVEIPLTASLQSPYAGGGAWPRWHHDNIQSGLSPNDTSKLAGKVAWTVSVSAPPSGSTTDYLNSPVVGSDGTVYQVGMDGNLYAITPDGGVQWQTMLQAPTSDPHPSTPIIASDNSLFIAFGETAVSGLYHVSPDGGILSIIPPAGDGFDLPPMLTNAGLLLGADDEAGGFAYSLGVTPNLVDENAAAAPVGGAGDQMSAVVGADDSTYWCEGSTCAALSPPDAGFAELTGWPLAPNGNDSYTSDLALDESVTGNLMILFGDQGTTSDPQQLVSLNPRTATIAWTLVLPAPTAAQATGAGFTGNATVGNSCPAIGADGTIYVGNFDGLHAVDGATGVEKSGFPFLTTSDVLTAPAIGGDGTIFFGTADGTFYAIHPNGTLRFTVTAGGRIAGSPAIGPSGAVYFTADDGFLYAVN